ncbi:MAG: hypothetical protein ACRD2R_09605 [Terriglobales bacterium]
MHFVIVDLDLASSPAQDELKRRHYGGYIPHVTLLDKNGKAIYDQAGEVGEQTISEILDRALQ